MAEAKGILVGGSTSLKGAYLAMQPSNCFPVGERFLWLVVIGCAAFAGANVRVESAPCCCPAPPPASSPRVAPISPESAPQKALVGRRRDGQWVRVEEHDGQLEETVISQGVVKPPNIGVQP